MTPACPQGEVAEDKNACELILRVKATIESKAKKKVKRTHCSPRKQPHNVTFEVMHMHVKNPFGGNASAFLKVVYAAGAKHERTVANNSREVAKFEIGG